MAGGIPELVDLILYFDFGIWRSDQRNKHIQRIFSSHQSGTNKHRIEQKIFFETTYFFEIWIFFSSKSEKQPMADPNFQNWRSNPLYSGDKQSEVEKVR